jgi:trans-aconitate methyltransferase
MSGRYSIISEFEANQSKFFDGWSDRFANAVEDAAVVAKLKRASQLAAFSSNDVVLDVGTGCGVMIPFFLHLRVQPENIAGIDLSKRMLEVARRRYPSIEFSHCSLFSLTPKHKIFRSSGLPTVIVFNACFANLLDSKSAVETAVSLLSPRGRVVISHPVGRDFVEMLHKREPHIVPNQLPNKNKLLDLFSPAGMNLTVYLDEDDFYCAIAEKA